LRPINKNKYHILFGLNLNKDLYLRTVQPTGRK
jgi:hypothetical protein